MAEYYGNGDRFYIDDYRKNIVCESHSGETYRIEKDETCNCIGFKIRGECRHVIEASQLGLFKRLIKMREKKTDLYCRSCGNAFREDDNYCGHCGKKRAN